MNVEQLIKKLKEMPPNAEVWWEFGSSNCAGRVDTVRFEADDEPSVVLESIER